MARSSRLAHGHMHLQPRGQVRNLLAILPEHTHVNSSSRHLLEELCAQNTTLSSLRQDSSIGADPPLVASLQTFLDINLNHQLRILSEPREHALLGCPRRAVHVVSAHWLETSRGQNVFPEDKIRSVQRDGWQVALLQCNLLHHGRCVHLDRMALVRADQVIAHALRVL